MASWILSSPILGFANAILSAIVPSKKRGSWGKYMICLRHHSGAICAMSTPSINMRPRVGSNNPANMRASDVFPAPFDPENIRILEGSSFKFIDSNSGVFDPLWAKARSLNSIVPLKSVIAVPFWRSVGNLPNSENIDKAWRAFANCSLIIASLIIGPSALDAKILAPIIKPTSMVPATTCSAPTPITMAPITACKVAPRVWVNPCRKITFWVRAWYADVRSCHWLRKYCDPLNARTVSPA